MKIHKFDVVKLKDKNKATILDVKEDGYLAEIVNSIGETLGNKIISDNDIDKIIFSKF